MIYLTLDEVIELHNRILAQSGGSAGIRDMPGLESALAQPLASFGGQELYPTVVEKASALGFSLIMNHPFVDGNKRIGHAALEVFLVLNGFEINATVAEQEELILKVAASQFGRIEFTEWLRIHISEI